jgi:methylase of polypeptide subunit release factors
MQSSSADLEKTSSAGVFRDSETLFYGICAQEFLVRISTGPNRVTRVAELGCGSGEIIAGILPSAPLVEKIYGYEIHEPSAVMARAVSRVKGLEDRYEILLEDFFVGTPTLGLAAAMSNPPYLPSHIPPSTMTELWGGADGTSVTKRILDHEFDHLLLMVSSYSDPADVVKHASGLGYKVSHYVVQTRKFGKYSRESIVLRRIKELASNGKAFVQDDYYNLAGVTWEKNYNGPDLSDSLLGRLQTFGE